MENKVKKLLNKLLNKKFRINKLNFKFQMMKNKNRITRLKLKKTRKKFNQKNHKEDREIPERKEFDLANIKELLSQNRKINLQGIHQSFINIIIANSGQKQSLT